MILEVLFYMSGFIIVWAMVGYPLSLKLIDKLYKGRQFKKDYLHQPTVTVMVVAHNEEKVILNKMCNIIELDYPTDKIEFVVASDNSTDKTNVIVRQFISDHQDKNIRLYETKARMGKTNAQNEAQKTITTEFMVMTDANSLMDNNSVRELMASFTEIDIAYVAGRLSISNLSTSDVSNSEASYWESDLATREIEGRVQTITAGNGAIYACRTCDYYEFNPIQCHDSAMPILYALQRKRAICNHDAIAYEKAGEVIGDEFARKVRMNRGILNLILPDIRILNIFKYNWFSYFYFGHRTCRYLLWISHLVLLLTSSALAMDSWFYATAVFFQLAFFIIAASSLIIKSRNKFIFLTYYYCMTIIAQWVGVYNMLTGNSKPTWEKAESTR